MTAARWCPRHAALMDAEDHHGWPICPAGHKAVRWWVVDVSLPRSDPRWKLYIRTPEETTAADCLTGACLRGTALDRAIRKRERHRAQVAESRERKRLAALELSLRTR